MEKENQNVALNVEQRSQILNEAKGLAKWLSIDLSIKIFGVEILAYHFPPKS